MLGLGWCVLYRLKRQCFQDNVLLAKKTQAMLLLEVHEAMGEDCLYPAVCNVRCTKKLWEMLQRQQFSPIFCRALKHVDVCLDLETE